MPLLIKKSKPKPPNAKGNFTVRPGTMAVMSHITPSVGAAWLLHELLGKWVNTRHFVRRNHQGTMMDFLFMTTPELQQLTGMSAKQLERAFAALKSSPYLLVAKKRLAVDHANERAIHLHQKALWTEICAQLDATSKEVSEKGIVTYPVNETVLPVVFKQLYKRVQSAP